jgi:hypothetical protein
LPRTTAEKGVVFELGATLEPGRAHLDADAIDRAIAETKWKNTTLADIIRKGVPLLADMKEVGILLLPDQDSYVQHRGSMQKKQVEERGEGHYLFGDWLLPRFPCVIHPKGSAARTDGKRRITNNWSAPHEGHRARRPGLPLSYNERVRSVLTAPEWPRIAYNKPTDVGQAMWVLWGAGFKLIKLKADFQSYFRQFALTPRRTCLQVWGSEVGIILDTRAEFGPADMPDMASQLSDLFVRTWGQRVESRLVSMGYYDTDETAAAFRAARAGKFHGRQLWCHVESGYVDDMQGVAPEGLPAEIQRQVLHGMCDEWNLPHAPEKEEATTGDLGYTGFVYSTEGEHPTMALTKDKRERYVTTFRELAKSTLTTRAALEGAVGKAIHAAVVSPEGKADMDGLYRCLLGGASARTNGPRSARHLSRVARAEAAAWAVREGGQDPPGSQRHPERGRDLHPSGEDRCVVEGGGRGGRVWVVGGRHLHRTPAHILRPRPVDGNCRSAAVHGGSGIGGGHIGGLDGIECSIGGPPGGAGHHGQHGGLGRDPAEHSELPPDGASETNVVDTCGVGEDPGLPGVQTEGVEPGGGCPVEGRRDQIPTTGDGIWGSGGHPPGEPPLLGGGDRGGGPG